MDTERRSRIFYLDFLRVLAMTAVILIHSSATQFFSLNYSSGYWVIHAVYDSFARWGVPVFVMISGAVFLHPQKNVSVRKLLTQYIPRIVIIYLFWSMIYMLKGILFDGDEVWLPGILLGILKGHFHMWYLPMLIGLYLIIPVVRHIVSDRKITEYYLILSLIFAYVIPSLLQLSGLIDRRLPEIGQSLVAMLVLHLPLGLMSYLVLGDYLNRYEISKKTEMNIYLLGFLGFIYTAVFTIISSHRYCSAYEGFFSSFSVGVLSESMAVFVFARKHADQLIGKKAQHCISFMARNSLGVYLIHPLILEIIQQTGFSTLSFNPMFSIPVLAFLLLFCSLVFSILIRKIPGLKRLI